GGGGGGMISFQPSPEERELRQLAREFAQSRLRPHARAAEQAGRPPEALAHESRELGLGGVALPAGWSGAGFSQAAACLVEEELAWGDPGLAVALGLREAALAFVADLLGEAPAGGPWEGPGVLLWPQVPDDPLAGSGITWTTQLQAAPQGARLSGSIGAAPGAQEAAWVLIPAAREGRPRAGSAAPCAGPGPSRRRGGLGGRWRGLPSARGRWSGKGPSGTRRGSGPGSEPGSGWPPSWWGQPGLPLSTPPSTPPSGRPSASPSPNFRGSPSWWPRWPWRWRRPGTWSGTELGAWTGGPFRPAGPRPCSTPGAPPWRWPIGRSRCWAATGTWRTTRWRSGCGTPGP